MESIRELYRIGHGPSSSHTMGPHRAAEIFKQRHPNTLKYRITLFGSLASTGKGHLTDVAVQKVFSPTPVEIIWKPNEVLPFHPNGMQFEALFEDEIPSAIWQVYSLGGGAIGEENAPQRGEVYDLQMLSKILEMCEKSSHTFWEYVEACEGKEIWLFLKEIWQSMQSAIAQGLKAEGILPGNLELSRKAQAFYRKTIKDGTRSKRQGLLSAYALAVSEENAAGGQVVTAPTCGSCGILPSVLRYLQNNFHCPGESILHALATAGLIGNLIKHNASISGAQVGCQGEVGVACTMAASAAAQLMGGSLRQIEYAAAMAMEHNLGLTCDPVAGLVQIPCIERNAFAANRAMDCADYALKTGGTHLIPFDEVVAVMWETGKNMSFLYRETALGGLAAAYQQRTNSEKQNR